MYKKDVINCEICGKMFYQKQGRGRSAKYCVVCGFEIHSNHTTPLRYSGQKYKNPPEKLDAIRKKYKNGVTAGILAEWIRGTE